MSWAMSCAMSWATSWFDLAEHRHLADELAEARVDHLEREAEPLIGKLGMGDQDGAGREPLREDQAAPGEFEEIVLAAEDQRPFARIDGERHADAIADVLFEASRPGEALAGMDHLRKRAAAAIEAGPDLTANGAILGDGHHCRGMCAARERQRAADQPQRLREPPAEGAHAGLEHLAGVDRGRAVGEALTETAPDALRQRGPVRLGKQRAKARIADLDVNIDLRRGRGFDRRRERRG